MHFTFMIVLVKKIVCHIDKVKAKRETTLGCCIKVGQARMLQGVYCVEDYNIPIYWTCLLMKSLHQQDVKKFSNDSWDFLWRNASRVMSDANDTVLGLSMPELSELFTPKSAKTLWNPISHITQTNYLGVHSRKLCIPVHNEPSYVHEVFSVPTESAGC